MNIILFGFALICVVYAGKEHSLLLKYDVDSEEETDNIKEGSLKKSCDRNNHTVVVLRITYKVEVQHNGKEVSLDNLFLDKKYNIDSIIEQMKAIKPHNPYIEEALLREIYLFEQRRLVPPPTAVRRKRSFEEYFENLAMTMWNEVFMWGMMTANGQVFEINPMDRKLEDESSNSTSIVVRISYKVEYHRHGRKVSIQELVDEGYPLESLILQMLDIKTYNQYVAKEIEQEILLLEKARKIHHKTKRGIDLYGKIY